MELRTMHARARSVALLYDRRNIRKFGKTWTSGDFATGFAGDVGDLCKVVQSIEGIRDAPAAHPGVAHELADCLWSVLTLADRLGVDLEEAFTTTMDDLESKLLTELDNDYR
jgi:NTP pyrophosphatase (non-canonical NTP hydrolase)